MSKPYLVRWRSGQPVAGATLESTYPASPSPAALHRRAGRYQSSYLDVGALTNVVCPSSRIPESDSSVRL